jgi:UDP-2,3-diacylglucosamine pyrophosphatase LpxH
VYDAIILSDLHLGSSHCQVESLGEFLGSLVSRHLRTNELILNGDVFDSLDFRRLNPNHWLVLSLLRQLSQMIQVVWITGNHDGPTEEVGHLLGTETKSEHLLISGGQKILILHGHIFDPAISGSMLSRLGDSIYFLLQRIDPTHYFINLAERVGKSLMDSVRKVEGGAIEYARRMNYSAVCCGHTHTPVYRESQPVNYFNSGCWTEAPCTYLSVSNGVIQLRRFDAGAGRGDRRASWPTWAPGPAPAPIPGVSG